MKETPAPINARAFGAQGAGEESDSAGTAIPSLTQAEKRECHSPEGEEDRSALATLGYG